MAFAHSDMKKYKCGDDPFKIDRWTKQPMIAIDMMMLA
jgi:hypothetical protein